MRKMFIIFAVLFILTSCDYENEELIQSEPNSEKIVEVYSSFDVEKNKSVFTDIDTFSYVTCFGETFNDYDNFISKHGLNYDESGICIVIFEDVYGETQLYSFGSDENTKKLDIEIYFRVEDIEEVFADLFIIDISKIIFQQTTYDGLSIFIDDSISSLVLKHRGFFFTIFDQDLRASESIEGEYADAYDVLYNIYYPKVCYDYDLKDYIVKSSLFYEDYFSAIGTELIEDKELIENEFGLGQDYLEYKGTINGVNIYRKEHHPNLILFCTMDMVQPTPLGAGFYLPGGTSGSCHRSVFAVEDGVAYRLSGITNSTDLSELQITPQDFCKLNGICIVTPGNYIPSVSLSEEIIDNDSLLLNPDGNREFKYLGMVDGFRLYKRVIDRSSDIICTMDMVPSYDLGDGYSTFESNSGSCFEYTVAVRNGVVYQIDGNGTITTLEELGIEPRVYCETSGRCIKKDED